MREDHKGPSYSGAPHYALINERQRNASHPVGPAWEQFRPTLARIGLLHRFRD